MALFNGDAGNNHLVGTDDDDELYGWAGSDILEGGAGDDIINGGIGADEMIGGSGDDIYYVDFKRGDLVIEEARGGTDTVYSSVSYVLVENIENLTLATGAGAINGHGNELSNEINGNESDNELWGHAGNDYLNGWAGADMMYGGIGNDFYVVDNAGDLVSEDFNEGTDSVGSSITYTLGANVEHLYLQGNAAINGTGNGLDNHIYGNSNVNVIAGGDGDDWLDGGAGADTMMGEGGDDEYGVDNVNDTIVESSNGGTDEVVSSVSYALSSHVENLVLANSGGSINGTGNEDNNIITGNSSGNVLVGAGGDDLLFGGGGADTMIGGADDDVYSVDDVNDVVVENQSDGNDTVQSSVSYALAANMEIEKLVLLEGGAIDGTGNNLDNYIHGNSSDNVLSGGDGNDKLFGMGGADTMIGGIGDDQFFVEHAGDVVTENDGEGIDDIFTSLSYSLAATPYVENLYLQLGAGNINGTGNGLDNEIWGNSDDNVLDGGAGVDTLRGRDGNDTYYLDTLGDSIAELAGEGIDWAYVSFTNYVLDAGVENGSVYTNVGIQLDGNDLDNELYGAGGGDKLVGGAGMDFVGGGDGGDDLYGSAGNDSLSGDGDNDYLVGGLDNDTLGGGAGDDHFVFANGDGIDTVTDFVAGDGANEVIDLQGYGIASYVQLQSFMAQVGNDVVIAFDASNQITLQNVALANLNQSDFLLS